MCGSSCDSVHRRRGQSDWSGCSLTTFSIKITRTFGTRLAFTSAQPDHYATAGAVCLRMYIIWIGEYIAVQGMHNNRFPNVS